MKISVKLQPNAKVEKIEKISETEYRVWVKAPPREGKANKALVSLLAEYFDLPRRCITLIKGLSSRQKIVEIL